MIRPKPGFWSHRTKVLRADKPTLIGWTAGGRLSATRRSTDLFPAGMVMLIDQPRYSPAFAVQDYLTNTVYNQAVVVWTEVTRPPPESINVDLNRDGKFDVTTWPTAELDAVISAAGDSNFDHNIFLVDDPNDGSFRYMDFGQRFGFVFADTHLRNTQTAENTIAHELGHGTVRLMHPDQNGDPDPTNLMRRTNRNPTKLRRVQWGLLNPRVQSPHRKIPQGVIKRNAPVRN